MRVKESYYDNLERLNEKFPNQELLSVMEVARFTGLDYRTVSKRFAFTDKYISKAKLARAIS
jgi:hypothetical protein